MTHVSDLQVAKMYFRSKKNVYGIDNELQLVEQVQRCMRGIFSEKILNREKITSREILTIFDHDSGKQEE